MGYKSVYKLTISNLALRNFELFNPHFQYPSNDIFLRKRNKILIEGRQMPLRRR